MTTAAPVPSPAPSSRRPATAIAGRVARLGVADPDRLVEQLWLLVDGLYLQAAYRDRLDDRLDPAGDAAVDLARRLVGL